MTRQRRGSQVVRLRSAKPLFAGSIPAPASTPHAASVHNGVSGSKAGSIDSLAAGELTLAGFVHVARLPPAPFPPRARPAPIRLADFNLRTPMIPFLAELAQ